jgi:hypothetical protein
MATPPQQQTTGPPAIHLNELAAQLFVFELSCLSRVLV